MSDQRIVFQEDDFKLAHHKDLYIDKVYENHSFWRDFFIRLKANKGAVVGLICICIIILLSIIAPMVSHFQINGNNLAHQSLPPKVPFLQNLGIADGYMRGKDMYAVKKVKDVFYLFGTDTMGRDIWLRTWSGTRISLLVAGAAIIIDMAVGMTYGLISGYFGGKVDMVMQRIIEIINSIPTLVIATLMLVILKPGIVPILFVLVLTGWIGMSRIARAQMLKLKEQEFVLASKTLGASDMHIIFKDILPNIFGQLIIMSMFSIPNAIFMETTLSFVGLGIPAPNVSLGVMISEGFKSFMISPYMTIIPAVILAILMLSFNLLADGLKDAFDPKMKEM
ncbi:oligopeptide transport system permease protein [Fusobacterium sp. PH5-7]|uniref:ABC transporter permease n=1 Tax=Fusobacterium sp. PH5-7 TaxID=2940528 RepID=UPI00247415DB|nr:ABC transporter permease [Fusobacterium sp. PH5-7]MDH6457941.1 oligopeptide transport system permease protein [Fusobacterium sp. PH5-7]